MLRFFTSSPSAEPLSFRISNWCLRSAVTALVLTGQLFPAGTVNAQDNPPQDDQPLSVTPAVPSVEAKEGDMRITAAGSALAEVAGDNEWGIVIRPHRPRAASAVAPPKLMADRPASREAGNVSVQVSQIAGTSFQPWGVHPIFAEPSLWRGPTSAFLFDRPLPYWQLRGDFHHLRPFISRLR